MPFITNFLRKVVYIIPLFALQCSLEATFDEFYSNYSSKSALDDKGH